MKYLLLIARGLHLGPTHKLAGTRPGGLFVTGCGLDFPNESTLIVRLTSTTIRCGDCFR
jgi:hypothetical protein